MADAALRSLRFRNEREAAWRRLDELITQIERRSAGSLTDEEMIEIPALYRAALSSLSVARATSLDSALVNYLEALCARAYFFVYGARSTMLQRLNSYFSVDWPAAVRAIGPATLVALIVTVVSAAAAFGMVWLDSDWYYAFIDDSLSLGRNPSASTEFLRHTLYHDQGASGLSMFAAFLFQHNAQIALFAFALGFAFGAPSIFLLAQNGCMLGAMFALYASRGLTLEFAGWIFIHGVTELFAIILAGAAGLQIGWAIAFPGNLTRLAAAERAGKRGGAVMIGVVLMLLIAGLLEGFARQLVTSDLARWSIAGLTLLLWTAYYYAPRRRERAPESVAKPIPEPTNG